MSSPKRAKYATKDEGTNETEYLKSLQAIEKFQDEMRVMRDKCDQDVLKLEQKLEIEKKPIYDKREQAISLIPNFWVTALMNHPDISALLDESEEEYLLYISRIQVQIVGESTCSFTIIFHCKENPYFKNTTIIKDYLHEYQDGKEVKKVTTSTILWKDGQDISAKLKERKSFLFWLTSQDFGITDFDIGQIIKEDLWINPLPYYLLSDLEQDDNSDEEEDEDSDDDVFIIEDSDDKSTAAEPEEESDNESDEYDSPASPEVQNEN